MGVDFAFPTQTLHLFNEEKSIAEQINSSPKEITKTSLESFNKEKFDRII